MAGFSIGQDCNTMIGKSYEEAVFMYTLINNYSKNTDLGREIVFADDWDDLVVKNNNGEYVFSQIKIVNNENDKIDSQVLLGKKRISLKEDDFYLKKYFMSYLRIKDQFYSKNNYCKDYTMKSTITKLIFFTNARLDRAELQQEIGLVEEIESGAFCNDIPNTDKNLKSYRILNPVNPIFLEKISDVKSDLQVLAEQLAKYSLGTIKSMMDFNRDELQNEKEPYIFRYYHRALFDEEVIECFTIPSKKRQKDGTRKDELRGKFTQKFKAGEQGLSEGAQMLRNKIIHLIREKTKTEKKVQEHINNATWKLSDDFIKKKTEDRIFLPTYEMKNEDIEEFFNLLELRVNQLDIQNMLKAIRDSEIRDTFLENYDVDPGYIEHLIDNFIKNEWQKSKKIPKSREAWILKDDTKLFIEKLKTSLSRPKALQATRENIKYLENITGRFGLHYEHSALITMKDLEQITAISTSSNILSAIKLLQYLKMLELKYFFITLSNRISKEQILSLIDAFKDNIFELLVISYRSLDNNVRSELSRKLSEVIADTHKKIIFLVPNNSDSSHGKKLDDNKLGLQYLTDPSKFLQQKINIQKQTLELSNIIKNSRDYELIDGKVIDRFINLFIDKQIINISMKPLGMCNIEGAYSKFESIDEVEKNMFIDKLVSEESNDIYIVSGILGSEKITWFMDYLKNSINNMEKCRVISNMESHIVLLNQSKTENVSCKIQIADENFEEINYKEVCLNNPKKSIYWIKLKNQNSEPKFILEQIYNPNFYVEGQRFCDEVAIDESIKNELASSDFENRYVIREKKIGGFKDWLKRNGNVHQINENFQIGKINVVSYDDPESSCQRIIAKDVSKPVHWLEFYGKRLIWRKSDGSIETMINHKDRNNNFEDLKKMDDSEFIGKTETKRDIIIVSDPGMGKSTTLMNLCLKYTSQDFAKLPWVITVNLKNHLLSVKTLNMDSDDQSKLKQIVEFLCSVDHSLKDEFAKKVLKLALTDEEFPKPLIIAFDGFDEVLDEPDRSKILKLLKFLKKETMAKFIITARLHYEKTLEHALSTFAVRLCPMDKNTKYKFAKNYLETRLSLMMGRKEHDKFFGSTSETIENSKIGLYIKKFLSQTQDLFKDNKSRFIDIPLQLYLTLDSCLGHLKNWVQHRGSHTLDFKYLDGDICQIYERFINRKYNLFYEKFNIKQERFQAVHKKYFDECHRKIVKCDTLKSHLKKSVENVKDLVLSAGITRYQNGNIEFIHLSFADYYAADIFIRWIEKRRVEKEFVECRFTNTKKEEYFIKKILLEEKYRDIRQFINCQLRQYANEKCIVLEEKNYNPELLFIAIEENHSRILSFIVYNFDADINVRRVKSENKTTSFSVRCKTLTPLSYASGLGYLPIVEFLVKTNPTKKHIDAKGYDDWTALHCACYHGKWDIVDYLIGKGANVNAKTNDGKTVLHFAVGWPNNRPIVENLLRNGANVRAEDSLGWTALHFASATGDQDVVRLLIEKGAIVNAPGTVTTAFHLACTRDNLDIVKILIRNDADIEAKGNLNKTALLLACEFRKFDIAKFLIEKNANVNAKDKNGTSILHYVSCHGNLEIINLLISRGVDINAKDENGKSALHVASQFGKLGVVSFLVKQVNDVNAKTKNGLTALDYAKRSGHSEVIQILAKNGANYNKYQR